MYHLTKAFSARGTGLESFITLAPIASNNVNTTPIFTDSWLGPAFIFIFRETHHMKNEQLGKSRFTNYRRMDSILFQISPLKYYYSGTKHSLGRTLTYLPLHSSGKVLSPTQGRSGVQCGRGKAVARRDTFPKDIKPGGQEPRLGGCQFMRHDRKAGDREWECLGSFTGQPGKAEALGWCYGKTQKQMVSEGDCETGNLDSSPLWLLINK